MCAFKLVCLVNEVCLYNNYSTRLLHPHEELGWAQLAPGNAPCL